jgi:mono/diheme cytochrome c family protein
MVRLAPPIVLVMAFSAFSTALATLAAEDQPVSPEQVQFFESQVRPVLVEHCLGCHGDKKVKAGLRLDSKASALKGGDSGPAIVPGKPDDSHLVAAIRYEGPEMPPKGKLTQRQVEALTQWIKMGAPWPGGATSPVVPAAEPASNIRRPGYAVTDVDRAHWAFRPLKRPSVPMVQGAAATVKPIDAFLRAGLEAKGLNPNPPASKHELIRRVTYDLTGLPPTPAEVDAFEGDTSPDAFEKLVDRLLESPRYGEKWGRHWLDLVRFAETNSYERDGVKPNAWRYRDYVIRSFNQDKPYDRFIREQLAGDELPDGGTDGLIATGYYRLGLWDDEPADREQARYDGLDDVVATTGQVFLGLTIDCARCHDHKLDPIPQKDYYRFLSFFQNVNHYRNGGPTDEATLLADEAAKRAFEQATIEMSRKRNEVQAAIAVLEAEFKQGYEKSRGEKVATPDLEDLTYRFYRDTWEKLPEFDALKPEETGKLPNGLFSLASRSREQSFGFVFEGTLIVPKDGRYTFYLDSDDGSRLTVDGFLVAEYDGIHGEGKGESAAIELKQGRRPIRLDYFQGPAGAYGLTVSWSGPGFSHRSLSASSDGEARPKPRGLTPAEFARVMRREAVAILGEDKAKRYRELRKELDDLKTNKVPGDRALVVTEAGPEAAETQVMLRGNPHSPGDKVEPGFLQVVASSAPVIPSPPPGSKTTGRRTVLADWIASPENPLTARVMANRVWQYHFGRGIVRSSSNLGTQGDKPTHPELVDWLACELIAKGWSLKAFHRVLLNSDAYKMSSKPDEKALAADPMNDRFWRFDMRRLTAEEIRDSILAVTGTLNLKMYGPGVYPEIPLEVMAGQSVPGAGWGKSSVEDQSRRSVYVHVKRSLILPILETFDLAETDRSSPVRFVTTQPTQALGMLNGSFMNRQARAFASRLKREAGDDNSKQVELALHLATGRKPNEKEIKRGVTLISALIERDGATAELALESFCLVVLNLNEFLYLD